MRLMASENEDSMAAVQARLLFRGLGITRAELKEKVAARCRVKSTESEYSDPIQPNITMAAIDNNINEQSHKTILSRKEVNS